MRVGGGGPGSSVPSQQPRTALPTEPCPPAEVDAPCAEIGKELRCVFGDLAAAPLPGRLADLFAALEADCAVRGQAVRRKM